ncbi:MAG: hypothetical protein ACON3Z_03815 [Bradymonadia bacterium]
MRLHGSWVALCVFGLIACDNDDSNTSQIESDSGAGMYADMGTDSDSGMGGAGGAGAEGGAGGAGAEGGAGGAGGMEPSPMAFELTGTFTDGFGRHEIDENTWTTTYEGSAPSVFEISTVDLETRFLVARNGDENEYNPGLWSRFDWVWSTTGLYYCQTAYAAETEDDALAIERPDDADPSMPGTCGEMFPWSSLALENSLPLIGSYLEGMLTHNIDERVWAQTYEMSTSHFVFTEIESTEDNTQGYVIARNADTNSFGGGLWSRMDWLVLDGIAWYCQIAYDAIDADAARDVPPADTADVATGGCNTFPWSVLDEPLDEVP